LNGRTKFADIAFWYGFTMRSTRFLGSCLFVSLVASCVTISGCNQIPSEPDKFITLDLEGVTIAREGLDEIGSRPAQVTPDGLKALQGLPIIKLSIGYVHLTYYELARLRGLPLADLTLTDQTGIDQATTYLRGSRVRTISGRLQRHRQRRPGRQAERSRGTAAPI
jgi:hypothetical protein